LGKTTIQKLDDDATARGVTLYDAVVYRSTHPDTSTSVRTGLTRFLDVMRELQETLTTGTASQLVQTVLERAGYWAHWEEQTNSDPEAVARLDNLQELVNAAREFEDSSEDKSLVSFLEKVSLASGLDVLKEDGGSVTLMTVHLAKGLEFPIVYITGLEEGLFPIGETSFDEKELEEERRLAYVGMTRAREILTLSSASSRKIYGRSHWNVPSRFIAEAGLAPETPSSFRRVPEPPRPTVAGFDPDEDARPSPQTGGGNSPLRVGHRVRHPVFGEGKLLDKAGSGENLKLTVLFDSGARKQFLARFANFESIS